MTQGATTDPFDPLRPAPGETVEQFREKLRAWAGPVTDGEWEMVCSLAGIPPSD